MGLPVVKFRVKIFAPLWDPSRNLSTYRFIIVVGIPAG